MSGKRVVVVGATGNLGTAVLESLRSDPDVASILGVARRRPEMTLDKVEWHAADIIDADLATIFEGADAVVHLAWLIQPSRDETQLRAVNVEGSARVFAAAGAAEVPVLLYASSVGAYSPGPKDRMVDEKWPADGVQTSFYGRHKAEVESLLGEFELEHPEIRVARMRPGLIFRREAATGIRRLFLGPIFPGILARPSLIPAIPDLDRLRFQAVHGEDVAEAFRLALHADDAWGAFNVAADPVLDPGTLSAIFGARRVRMSSGLLRAAAAASWRLRLQPTPPGWLDLGLGVPLMDTTRARQDLGWEPRHTATEALLELIEGLRDGAGYPTPPLDPATSGPLRWRELRTGVGARADSGSGTVSAGARSGSR
jgi:UDP-glucose 4-epimerase